MQQSVTRPQQLKGKITPPADKSISHRSLILNSIAVGEARITNFLPAADCLSTLSCLKSLGVDIVSQEQDVIITGTGRSGYHRPDNVLDAGNSGTTMRLLTGLLAAQSFESTISGDQSLNSRPMGRVIHPLELMGARVQGQDDNTRAPLTITGGNLHGIDYELPVASAQVKSAILIAALFAEGNTTIHQPALSRDHTELMLRSMGADIQSEGLTVYLSPGLSELQPVSLNVPADISSAAFWLVAGCIHPDARVRIEGMGMNPTRNGIIEVLQSMGASLIIENQRFEGDEPVADITVESSTLRGTTIEGDIIPRLIDEIPVIAVAASVANGTTVIRDAAELRIKESDRIKTTATELSRLGAQIEETPDGMIVYGVSGLVGNTCDSHGDHRLAMSLAVAGLIAEGETAILNSEAVNISYPDFWKDLSSLT